MYDLRVHSVADGDDRSTDALQRVDTEAEGVAALWRTVSRFVADGGQCIIERVDTGPFQAEAVMLSNLPDGEQFQLLYTVERAWTNISAVEQLRSKVAKSGDYDEGSNTQKRFLRYACQDYLARTN